MSACARPAAGFPAPTGVTELHTRTLSLYGGAGPRRSRAGQSPVPGYAQYARLPSHAPRWGENGAGNPGRPPQFPDLMVAAVLRVAATRNTA